MAQTPGDAQQNSDVRHSLMQYSEVYWRGVREQCRDRPHGTMTSGEAFWSAAAPLGACAWVAARPREDVEAVVRAHSAPPAPRRLPRLPRE